MRLQVTVRFVVEVPDDVDPEGVVVDVGSLTFDDMHGDNELSIADESDVLSYETVSVEKVEEESP